MLDTIDKEPLDILERHKRECSRKMKGGIGLMR